MKMNKVGNFLIALSGGLFVIFFANVVLGSLRKPVFLTDLQEMLTLAVACSVFVIAILFHEKGAEQASTQAKQNNESLKSHDKTTPPGG